MRTLVYSGKFKRDAKRMKNRGVDLNELKILLTKLINEEPLEPKYSDHPL